MCHVDQEQNQTKQNQHAHKVEICKSNFVISYLSLLHVLVVTRDSISLELQKLALVLPVQGVRRP